MRSPVDGQWLSTTAGLVLAAVEERRSTWQTWHVRAEAQRQIRAAEVPTGRVDELVDRVVAEVLNTRSVLLARPAEVITEPAALRRSDGSSVYTVAGVGHGPAKSSASHPRPQQPPNSARASVRQPTRSRS
jgi:hypothetical protein